MAALFSQQKLKLLDEIARNPEIPSPPAVIVRVLQKASEPECMIADLWRIIQLDAGLSGRILQIVNSALFGLSRPVTSISRALAVVGVNSARLLVLAIALPEMNKTSRLPAPIAQRYWKSSIAGAIIAHALSLRLGCSEVEDDMVVGLLRDIGEIVMARVFPTAFEAIARLPEEVRIDTQCELEDTHCGVSHAEVSAFILDRWRLPSDITEAVRWHHNPEKGTYSTPKAESRAFVLHFATRAAQLVMYPHLALVLRDLQRLAKDRLQMSSDDLYEFLRPLGQVAADFASMLKVDMGVSESFGSALTRASDELIRISMSASLENEKAQERFRHAETEAQRWRQEAVFDSLTKAFNRRFLDCKLAEYFDAAKNPAQRFGLLFIDLDHFKSLNDQLGHAFGDFALQQVAECLRREARLGDIVVRQGGDEFCILAEPIDEAGLRSLGERILAAIRRMTFSHEGKDAHIGASIGAVCTGGEAAWGSAHEFMAGADRAMYVAKSRGGNSVIYLQSLNDAGTI